LFEITCGIGIPWLIDETMKKRTFGNYDRVLVEIDLSKRIFDEVMVECERFAFYVMVVYECLPEFFINCFTIGHSISLCNKLLAKKDDRLKPDKPKSKG